MHPLAQNVLAHIRQQDLLRAGHRLGLAVSGGIDSVAMLRLMIELRSELGIVLSVVHFNHSLRGADSDADQQFVAELARQHGLELHLDHDDVARHAREERMGVEAAARELRYAFFRSLIHRSCVALDKISTGHTLDDQAETVLMRLIRGAGMRGLGGIYPRIPVEDEHGEVCGEIIRPLLSLRRRQLERYLLDLGQNWRDDSTNADHAFTRNRLRHLILPVLENEFNPAIAQNVADLADIARAEEEYWDNEIAGWMGTVVHWSEPEWARVNNQFISIASLSSSSNPESLQSKIDNASWLVMNASVSRAWFIAETEAVQRRLIKSIGEQAGVPLEFKHVEQIRHCSFDPHSGKQLSLPLGWKFIRTPDELLFLTPDLRQPERDGNYDYELTIPGDVLIPELQLSIQARRVPAGAENAYNPDHLLDADLSSGILRLRNWRPGDRYWPAHTKSPRKVKELLQEHQIIGPARKLWPVAEKNGEILWLRGFSAPAKYAAKPGHEAVVIVATPLDHSD